MAKTSFGRIPEANLPKGALHDCLVPHIVLPVSGLVPYSQLNLRRRGKWPELYRNRAVTTDIFSATKGQCVRQKYLYEEVVAIVKELDANFVERDVDDLCYRIRAMMSHLRSAKGNSYPTPQRFVGLDAVLA